MRGPDILELTAHLPTNTFLHFGMLNIRLIEPSFTLVVKIALDPQFTRSSAQGFFWERAKLDSETFRRGVIDAIDSTI